MSSIEHTPKRANSLERHGMALFPCRSKLRTENSTALDCSPQILKDQGLIAARLLTQSPTGPVRPKFRFFLISGSDMPYNVVVLGRFERWARRRQLKSNIGTGYGSQLFSHSRSGWCQSSNAKWQRPHIEGRSSKETDKRRGCLSHTVRTSMSCRFFVAFGTVSPI